MSRTLNLERRTPNAERIILECGDMSPLSKRGHVRAVHTEKFEAEIITAARPVIVKEILALQGDDMPDPIAHGRYLLRLNFTLLCQRRDQLLAEQLPMQLDLHPKYGGADEQ